MLADILAETRAAVLLPKELLVGIETSDDAAVYQLNARQAVVATTDFFMPIVDDPFDFGRIAAANALSDVYAMGGRPIFALALVGMPMAVLSAEVIRRVLAGGEAVCHAAGIPIAGGHTIDSVEPIYGLVGIGLVDPDHLKRNSDGRAGDVVVLGKALGIGVYSAALKKDRLSPEHYAAMVQSATQLNTPGATLATLPGVHAMTDVTGFGLLGHLLEIARGSGLSATVEWSQVPLLPGVAALAAEGCVTGASRRNFEAYGADVRLSPDLGPTERALLTDPQTSGGLLVTCAPEAVETVLATFAAEGFERASVIGRLEAGAASVVVR